MANKNIAVKHIQRNDTKANWLLSNPVLLLGELGIELDTFKIKVGNGVDNYSNLPYVTVDNADALDGKHASDFLPSTGITWNNLKGV